MWGIDWEKLQLRKVAAQKKSSQIHSAQELKQTKKFIAIAVAFLCLECGPFTGASAAATRQIAAVIELFSSVWVFYI